MHMTDKTHCTFQKKDVGKMILFHNPWYLWVWWWFLRVILRREVDPGVYVITDVLYSGNVEVCRMFFCPKCKKFRPYSEGCSDDKPDLCDECWAEEEVCD